MARKPVRVDSGVAEETWAPPPALWGGRGIRRRGGDREDASGHFQDPEAWSRRVLNIAVASLSLILAIPLLLLATVAVKLSSAGAAIYSQERVGLERRCRRGDRRSGSRGGPDRRKSDAGGTGLAQVNHRYDQCLEDVERKLSLDLAYIERTSPAEDLKIMLRTLPVILFRKGGL